MPVRRWGRSHAKAQGQAGHPLRSDAGAEDGVLGALGEAVGAVVVGLGTLREGGERSEPEGKEEVECGRPGASRVSPGWRPPALGWL